MAKDGKKVSFLREEGRDFTTVLRERVNNFFSEAEISSRANFAMYSKTIFYVTFVSVVYASILTGFGGLAGLFSLFAVMGFAIAVGAMNIAHDALHGAYATTSPGNRALGFVMDICGASSFYWKKEHTIDHHTFTNISGHDADLGVPYVMRLCPKAPRHWFHRYQHLYAPLLYSINLIKWVYYSDMKRIYNILKHRNNAPGNPSDTEIVLLFVFKLVHAFLFIALPILLLPYAWWIVVLGYLTFLATAGLTMTVVFQLAHIVEDVAFPLPDEEGKIENSFLKHQLATTSNFAVDSWWVNFMFGGLNFQVEHHIFPHVCHTHLRKISPIVKQTAEEFGLPYHSNPSFIEAICSHFRTLKKLGQNP